MNTDILLGIAAGLGLAAACGFRVFVPMLVASIATRAGVLELNEGFAWLGSTPALILLSVATALEIAAYYIPVVDNLLDTIATPAAAIAGALVASAVMVDIDPWLRWTLALIAGAGLASAVQVPTAAVRGGSTVATAGVANSIVSTTEAVGSTALSALSVLAPILVPVVLIGLLVVFIRWRRRRRREVLASAV